MTAGLTDFFKYNLWANRRLLDACAGLTDEQLDATSTGIYGNIRQTLVHLCACEEGYAYNFTRTAPTPRLEDDSDFPGFDELRRRAESSGQALINVVEAGDLNQIFYLDGGTYEASAIIVLIQVINHGVDHRSQISTLLTQQGIEPPVLDSWAYNDATR